MRPPAIVSVIMPAFNTARYLSAAIDSVLAQTRQDWELIVVNDGSSDETGTIAEDFASRDPRIRVLHQPNAGPAVARNRGCDAADANCRYTALLDSDDLWYPDALETMLGVLERDPTVVGVHGLRTYIRATGERIVVDGATEAPQRRREIRGGVLRTVSRTAPTTFEVLAYGNCVFPGAQLVRREAMQRAGAFDPRSAPAEDWDVFLRVTMQGPMAFIPKAIYGYRLHASNITRDVEQKNAAVYYVRHKLSSDAALSPARRATLLAGFRWYELYRAAGCFRAVLRQLAPGGKRGSAPLLRKAATGVQHLSAALAGNRRLAQLAQAR